MLSLLWTIIIGFVVGLVARALMPGKQAFGFIITTALGVVGALVATFAGRALGLYAPEEASGFIVSVVGALVVLFIYGAVMKKRDE